MLTVKITPNVKERMMNPINLLSLQVCINVIKRKSNLKFKLPYFTDFKTVNKIDFFFIYQAHRTIKRNDFWEVSGYRTKLIKPKTLNILMTITHKALSDPYIRRTINFFEKKDIKFALQVTNVKSKTGNLRQKSKRSAHWWIFQLKSFACEL